MSGNNLLVDTNALIFLHEGLDVVRPYLSDVWYASTISEIELLGVPALSRPAKTGIRALLDDCILIDFSPSIKELTIKLRQQRSIKIPDAIIAATAIWLDFPLLTADTGFTNIPGLSLLLMEKR